MYVKTKDTTALIHGNPYSVSLMEKIQKHRNKTWAKDSFDNSMLEMMLSLKNWLEVVMTSMEHN
jgi:hypothetical protein